MGETPRPNQQILEEASTWFVAFRSGDLDANARQQFHIWLKRSPEHIHAYLEIAAIYADIPVPESGHTPQELIAQARSSRDLNVVPVIAGGRGVVNSQTKGQSSRDPVRLRLATRVLAAALLFAFVSAGAWLYAERNIYRTGTGEQRSVTLSDGSIIELNARSKLRVVFHDRQRDVQLLEGQALFRVAKDRNRPFVVHAGATSVRAVGTQFDIYRRSTATTVTVLEGSVAVLSVPLTNASETGVAREAAPDELFGKASASAIAQRKLAQEDREILLVAGEQAIVSPSDAHKAKPVNIESAIAWTRHELVFDGTPLSEVVEEFHRYSTHRLVLDNPELAKLRISGQYTSTSPESLVRFLSLQEGVVVTHENGETHIRKE
jgi:transmembrane sensor